MKFIYLTILFVKLVNAENISRLLNQTYLISAASHGLSIKTHSSAYIYSGFWTQLIEIKLPRKLWDASQIPVVKSFNCTNVPMTENFEKVCKLYNEMLEVLYSTNNQYRKHILEKVAHIIRDSPVHSWFRTKRSLIPVVGEALGFLFGTANSDDVREIKNSYIKLSNELNQNNKQTALLSKQLLGLSLIQTETAEKLGSAIKEITEHLTEIDTLFNKHWHEIRKRILSNDFVQDLEVRINEALIRIITNIYDIDLMSTTLIDIEQSLLQLRKGNLPINLVPWKKLYPILLKVEKDIRPLYEIAIDESSWDLYYNLALTKFSIVENGILIKFLIPIKTRNTKIKYNLLSPITSPIPCTTHFCQWFERIKSNDTFITLDLKDRLWLTDSDYINLFGEISISSLNCLNIGNEKLCYSFDRSFVHPVTACTSNLWNWNPDNIIEFCKFEISLQESYFPIKISPDLFVVHKKAVPNFDVICLSKGSKRRELTNWVEEIKLETGCYIESNNFSIYGELKYRDNRLDVIQSDPPNFLFSNKLFNDLARKIEYVQSERGEEKEVKLKKFDAKKFENILQLDQKALTAAMNELLLSSAEFGGNLDFLMKHKLHESNLSYFNAILDAISQTIILSLFYMIIIILVIRGHIVMFIVPQLVIPVEAKMFETPQNNVNPINTIVENPVELIFRVIILISGVVVWLIIYKFELFKAIEFKSHNGKYFIPSETMPLINYNCYMFITFNFYSKRFYKYTLHEVVVKLPVTALDDQTSHGYIFPLSLIKTWMVVKDNNDFIFEIASEINLIIDIMDGREIIKNQKVKIRVSDILWNTERPPFRRAIQTYGKCSISYVRLSNCRPTTSRP